MTMISLCMDLVHSADDEIAYLQYTSGSNPRDLGPSLVGQFDTVVTWNETHEKAYPQPPNTSAKPNRVQFVEELALDCICPWILFPYAIDDVLLYL